MTRLGDNCADKRRRGLGSGRDEQSGWFQIVLTDASTYQFLHFYLFPLMCKEGRNLCDNCGGCVVIADV